MNHRSNNSVFQYNVLTGLIILSLQSAYAGVVRDDVDYQQFRDFAENKGKFAVGASNIEIKDKNNNPLGVVLNGVPMPDFSAVRAGNAVSVLTDPQYITSAAHVGQRINGRLNGRVFQPVFGYYGLNPDREIYVYAAINDNKHPDYENHPEYEIAGLHPNDYQVPRLNKLVTEVAPIGVSAQNSTLKGYLDKYSAFVRIGTGNQGVAPKNWVPSVESNGDCEKDTDCTLKASYFASFVTGGQVDITGAGKFLTYNVRNVLHTKPMLNLSQRGDSGSPMFGFNKLTNKWELVGLVSGGSYAQGFFSLADTKFNQQKIDENQITINNNELNKTLGWQDNGDYTSSLGETVIALSKATLDDSVGNIAVNKLNAPDAINHGKTVYLIGEKGVLNLKSNINQGAGGLYFETDFTVKADNPDTTWLGAGISVAKGKTVDWQVKNPKDDRLSKIGEGTLLVNGTGNNEGDISVGDGLVILNQKDGQAFNQVGIVSGRPTVKLENSNQVNPDNIYFGYRGGRLDLNGNDLTFNYIKNVDEGAKIVNHNKAKPATITIKTDASDKNKAAFNGVFGETNTDFFGNPLENKKHNGELNVVYKPDNPKENQTFLLSGGMNLNGNLTVGSGSLLLSGRPTPHAYDHIKKEEPFQDDDWLNRTFNASNIVVQENSKLTVGRNVNALNANIIAQNNSTVQLGFVDGKTPICVRSDYFGTTNCENKTYNETVLKAIPTTQVTGNLTLDNHAKVLLGKTNWEGSSDSKSSTSQLTLSSEAKWTMKNNSSVGHLTMEKGSQITLNSGFEKDNQTNQFNTLTIQGDLSGEGQFNYLTNVAGKQGDKVVVEGIASGSYILNVKDSGQEPKGDDLVLMDLTNKAQPETGLNVHLNNANKNGQDYVDLGAWRYDLKKRQNNQFVLAGKNTKPKNDTNSTNTTTGNTTTGNNTTTSNNTTTVSVPIVPNSPVVPTQPTQVIVPSAQSISKYTNLALSGRLAVLEANVKTLEPINQRLLDIHAKSRGIWVHHESAKQKNQSEHYRGYQQKHHLFQLGVDKETDLANGQLLLGVALSNTNSEQTFDEGHGDSRLILGGLYGRWLSPNRSWIAFDAGYGVAKHKLVLDNEKVSHNQNVAHLGVKVGKTWQLGALEIQPSLSARYHSLSNGRYQLDGANIQYGKWNAMAYQPELRLNYSFKTASGLELNPYLSTSYLYLSGRSHVDVNAYRFSLPMNRTLQNQAGVSIQKSKWHGKMYLNHERGKQNKGRSVGLMLNYEW